MLFRIAAALILAFSIVTATSADEFEIRPSREQGREIGQKIWHNEGRGKVENLTVWNKGEEFPSFGIGHFIWYPAGVEETFTESFPQLLQHLGKSRPLPAWLKNSSDAPWPNREQFYKQIDSAEMNSLRQLLLSSIPQQVEFIVQRMEQALPKMLSALPTVAQRQHVRNQFYRVARQTSGIYALIDYVNFKGEGVSAKERYQGQGWGLLQVLENMDATAPTMSEFVRAADFVLTRRVHNAPRDESRWLPGWRKRLQTYLNQ
jgi:hypothetical protein